MIFTKINYEKNKILEIVVRINKLGLIFVVFCFMYPSCNTNNNKQSHNTQNNISILLYPIDTPQDIRYGINMNNSFIRFIYNNPMASDTIIVNLDESDKISIKLLCDSINNCQTIKTGEKLEDGWELVLFLNDRLIYQCYNFDFNSPPLKIRRLIDYIIKFSPIEIELYDFS